MIQSGRTLAELLLRAPYIIAEEGAKQLIKRASKLIEALKRYFVNKGLNRLQKNFR